ncbi:MAG: hypothetical protein HY544_01965 [Candidatus Diapherotrites archaeon]|uniref:Uncharacterized protein n=1 Tax=Candidatus Iainarchaeum sp. TaxID=3101447 RepID=A0A8T3YKC9_9ARCH|nr:hypothetical protein [Candidatus Diapherotrites archaeon]
MARALTKLEFSLYSLLHLKFGTKEFTNESVRWYFSRPMLKKLIFGLVGAGWLKTKGRGKYTCETPQDAIAGFFEAKAENALKESDLSYCFTGSSAAEIWSDQTYMQRSWEYSPFFIKVFRKDLRKWRTFLAKLEINYFEKEPANVLGEFVILKAVKSMVVDEHNGLPVEPLDETVKFCESNKDAFEYVLAYFQNRHGIKTTASEEFVIKAGEAI